LDNFVGVGVVLREDQRLWHLAAAREDLGEQPIAERLEHRAVVARDDRAVELIGGVLAQWDWSRIESGVVDIRLTLLLRIQHLLEVDSVESLIGTFPSRLLAELLEGGADGLQASV
jgi:hypothetical protein